MKKNSNDERPNFNFDLSYELEIYIHAMYKNKRNKKVYKKLEQKYYSYREWKNKHAIEKYKYVTIESLKDLKWMFSRRLDIFETSETKITGVVLPIFMVMITMILDYFNAEINNLALKYISSMVLIVWILFYILKDMLRDDKRKYLYKDYISIIDELIILKSEKNMINSNGLSTDTNIK